MIKDELKDIFNECISLKESLGMQNITNLIFLVVASHNNNSDISEWLESYCEDAPDMFVKFKKSLVDLLAGETRMTLSEINKAVKNALKDKNIYIEENDGFILVESLQGDEGIKQTLTCASTAKGALMTIISNTDNNIDEIPLSSLMVLYGMLDRTNNQSTDLKDRIKKALMIDENIIGQHLLQIYDKTLKNVSPIKFHKTESSKNTIDNQLDNNLFSQENVRVIGNEQAKELLNEIFGSDYNQKNNENDSEEEESSTRTIKVCKMVDPFTDVPVVRRDAVVEQVATLMTQSGNRLIAIVGEKGSGLSYYQYLINEYLNQRYENKLQSLHGKKEYTLNVDYLRSELFKDREDFIMSFFSSIYDFLSFNNGVLFIDDFGSLFEWEKEGMTEMALMNMCDWKDTEKTPTIVVTMNNEQYSKFIEKSNTLNSMFVKVVSPNMDDDDVKKCYKLCKQKMERAHLCKIEDSILDKTIKLCKKHIKNFAVPSSVIRTIDIAGSIELSEVTVPDEITNIEKQYYENQLLFINNETEKAMKNHDDDKALDKIYLKADKIKTKDELKLKKKVREFNKSIVKDRKISLQSIQKAISIITGIPEDTMSEDEVKKVSKLKENLMSEVIGQSTAIDTVCRTLKRRVIGLAANKSKTIGNLIFCGESGVGKTILAKKLAKYMFGSENDMVRIDMSEFTEKYTMTKLIGTSAGFVGYENDGVLIKALKEHKYCIVLLDEIEKAAPEIFNLFLQIFDDGRVTSGSGELVDCTNCLFILTSNVGAKKSQDMNGGIGFSKRIDYTQNVYEKELKSKFAPEFLNRIDNIVVFNHLEKDDMRKIVELQLKGLQKTVKDADRELVYGEGVVDYILDESMKELNMGARPINRAIQNLIENPLADLIVDNYDEDIKTVKVTVNGQGCLLVEKGEKDVFSLELNADEQSGNKKKRQTRKKTQKKSTETE